ncbi:MAG: diacylglycerol kinase [Patescibacteria group bacterium]
MRIIKKIINSFWHSFHGLRYAYKREFSFQIEIWAGLVLVAVGYVAWPLRTYEFLFLVFSYIFILALELFNTALEQSLERLHPEAHELIGRSKDLASASVLMGIIFAGVVVCAIFVSHFIL